MELAGKVAVVTGGASGIGRALCRRFSADGASVVVADVDAPGAAAVARQIGGLAVPGDMSVEADVKALVDTTLLSFDRIDLFCANAGILWGAPPDDPPSSPAGPGLIGADTPDEAWDRMWRVNVLSHVYAARAVVPVLLRQGGGHLLVTASAAGLLTVLGNAPYEAQLLHFVGGDLVALDRIGLHGVGGAFRLERQLVPAPGEAPQLAKQDGRLP